ncbi:hypothetical protein L3X38_033238 [Prunus dulcis]|uniref:Integrase catalytic domain-containing protein n=1 Tax=Prunus dulcis TaxID=3755 RepID=A0AAD4VFJ9_PRUDU|nr:hypothetical protein L3X38_033238 [Prunus dulcis]
MTIETSTRIMDSRASRHVCNTLEGLEDHRKLSKWEIVLRVGNGTQISAKVVGTFHLSYHIGRHLNLKNVFIFQVAPLSIASRGGFSYFITFTDDYSRLGYVYLIKYKSKAFEKFKEFKNEVEKQTGKSIRILRSDRGGEYLSTEFLEYLKKHDILSQWTPPGTPQLNGVSERRNRTLIDMVRSMMSYTDLPVLFWGYALQTAAYLLNKVPSNSMPRTPHEMWFGRKPSLNHLKIWGFPSYVKKHDIDKLDARSKMCRFNGYPNVQKVELKEEPGEPHEPEVESDLVDHPVPLPHSPNLHVVWTLVDPPEGIVPIGNKWVFKRKKGSDGKVETYKARLVAKGYKQREGIDYEETFSPIAMIKSISILLGIAAYYDYEIWYINVKTAFLNGHLQEKNLRGST